MKNQNRIILIYLIFVGGIFGQECWDLPSSAAPTQADLPLCGNGILDFGEVCDDGNRIGGDGCNAWCSAFDAMTGTCTLAGRNSHCPFGRTVLGNSGSPSQSIFCDLRCIDSSLDGNYVIFADSGTLVKMDLFTDQVASSMSILSASIAQTFAPICSLAILEPDSSILVHECTKQRFLLLTSDGRTSTLVADLSDVLLPLFVKGAKATYFNKQTRKAIIAGVPAGNVDWCMHVYSMTIPTQANYSSGTFGPRNGADIPIFASIPCVAYNVVEGATMYPSFSVQGMQPKSISFEPCMQMHMPNSMCYVVYMERNDMQYLRAYIPENGGVDIAFASSTNTMNNALGHPIIKYGSKNMIYTSLGTCFQAESNTRTVKGRNPPIITLGNACKNAPILGLGCATPLNNPFMTEIMTSPYLLAEGLSVSHTHKDLTQIFSSKCIPLSSSPGSLNGMVNTSGPMLYKSILQSTYANTTPVDFVELPGIMDIVYITSTSVGLISTKRFTLYDRNNPGYCRATNLIYCPPGFFGTVETGVCAPCQNVSSTGYGKSVAWQIKCASSTATSSRRSLLSAMESAPYERFSSVVTRDVTEEHLSVSLCSFLTAKGLPCPTNDASAMTPLQQYNMAADAADSGLVLSQGSSLVQCLISAAERRTGKTLFRSNSAEYSTTWVSSGNSLLTASATSGVIMQAPPSQNLSSNNGSSSVVISKEEYLKILTLCQSSRGPIRGWLSCYIPYVVNTSLNTNKNALISRRLLQTGAQLKASDSSLVEHQGLTMASATSITWNKFAVNPPPSQLVADSQNKGSGSTNDSGFPIWLGIVIGVVGLGIVVMLLYIFYNRKVVKKRSR